MPTPTLSDAWYAHPPGSFALCSVDDGKAVVTGGLDTVLRVWDTTQPFPLSAKREFVRPESITAVALADAQDVFLAGTSDGVVTMHDFETGDQRKTLVRFDLPLRAIAFTTDGKSVVCAGMDGLVKIVDLDDAQNVSTFHGHDGPILGLAIDPKGELFCSMDWSRCWKVVSVDDCSVVHDGQGEDGGLVDAESVFNFGFSSDGSLLALPGKTFVRIVERSNWNVLFKLGGEHTDMVLSCMWAKNDQYIATAGRDKTVVIYDVPAKACVQKIVMEDLPICICWKNAGNVGSVVIGDTSGELRVWKDCVTLDGISASTGNKIGGGVMGGDGSGDVGESSRAGTSRMDDDDDVSDQELKQPVFQMASTPEDDTQRYLYWDMTSIMTYDDKGTHAVIEVEFLDGRAKNIRMNDHFKPSMGAVGPSGIFLGCPARPLKSGGKVDSSVYFKETSVSNGQIEWKFSLKGEEFVNVACGSGWAAAGTSSRLVYFMNSVSGMQRAVLPIPGDIVTMAASNEWLAVFYHRAPPMYVGRGIGDQQVSVKLIDVAALLGWTNGRGPKKEGHYSRPLNVKVVSSWDVHLAPGAQLLWATISEDFLAGGAGGVSVVVVDTAGRIQASIANQGNEMFVLADASQTLKASERMWPVGLSHNKLFGVIVKPVDMVEMTRMASKRRDDFPVPPFAPRPILLSIDMSIPFMQGEDVNTARTIAMHQLDLLAEPTEDGVMVETKSVRHSQLAIDKELLSMFKASLESSSWDQAYDYASMLKYPRPLDICMKAARMKNVPSLVRRLEQLNKLKFEQEEEEDEDEEEAQPSSSISMDVSSTASGHSSHTASSTSVKATASSLESGGSQQEEGGKSKTFTSPFMKRKEAKPVSEGGALLDPSKKRARK